MLGALGASSTYGRATLRDSGNIMVSHCSLHLCLSWLAELCLTVDLHGEAAGTSNRTAARARSIRVFVCLRRSTHKEAWLKARAQAAATDKAARAGVRVLVDVAE